MVQYLPDVLSKIRTASKLISVRLNDFSFYKTINILSTYLPFCRKQGIYMHSQYEFSM